MNRRRPPPEWLLTPPCWGIFDIYGNWRGNPYLRMTIAEQRHQNIENGYMTDNGKRIAQSYQETP